MASRIIDIDFRQGETDLIDLQNSFNDIGQEALFMNHYELADRSGDSPIAWKKFLMDPRVANYINEELDLLKKSKVAIMLKDIETTKSTGQAQLLNTLLNQTKTEQKKDGPVFIYTMIPLNEHEQHARNVVTIDGIDPFENNDESTSS
ncbi:MAG: hypothetical protein II625_00105 [Bacilli bacterium]|jgi:hypothetical protein|nr:hypothetical protein [Bacilli bacterium]